MKPKEMDWTVSFVLIFSCTIVSAIVCVFYVRACVHACVCILDLRKINKKKAGKEEQKKVWNEARAHSMRHTIC